MNSFLLLSRETRKKGAKYHHTEIPDASNNKIFFSLSFLLSLSLHRAIVLQFMSRWRRVKVKGGRDGGEEEREGGKSVGAAVRTSCPRDSEIHNFN